MGDHNGMDWSPILNWKLLAGPHEFPGPDGGTCINEAAIVAAGFEYRKVFSECDMPPCFSPVISAYALSVNDSMPDDQRQRLLPFVTRLAGTADVPNVENRRAEYLAMLAVNVFAAGALEAAQLSAEAGACRIATNAVEGAAAAFAGASTARRAGIALRLGSYPAKEKRLGHSCADRAATAATFAATAATEADAASVFLCATSRAASVAASYAGATACWAEAWDDALEALDGALAIGRQSERAPLQVAADRLERAKLSAKAHSA